jgi:hypothetical protein
MNISGASMENALASMATNRSNTQIRSEISMAILKSQMNQQKVQGLALVKMINSTSINGTGSLVNILV